MAPCQILVSGLDGRTLCLQFVSDSITGAEVGARVAAVTGIPQEFQRLVTGTREIRSDMCLADLVGDDGMLPSCAVLLRLRGGKGGFGSLLRGAATKAGQKKTSNFDACRDMNGRRLRHVNAEKKLKEWKADAKERELEKAAEEFLKKERKAKEENVGVYKELEKFRAETSRAMEEVGSAVVSGLAESRKFGADGKRKKIEAITVQAKRSRIWMMGEDEEADLDEVAVEDSHMTMGDDESTITTANLKEIQEIKIANLNVAETTNGGSLSYNSSEEVVCAILPLEDGKDVILEKQGNAISQASDPGPTDDVNPRESEKSLADGLINFADCNSAKEMELLGLERLKTELQERGLKCGGSLSERAGRLFLLKTATLEELDKKHFAAKSKGSKT